MKLPVRALLLVTILPLLAWGCRADRESSSQLGSLDNFARQADAEVHRNQCSGPHEVVLGIQKEDDHLDLAAVDPDRRSTVRGSFYTALTAVPFSLQRLYFGYGGRVAITPQADAICRSLLSEDEARFAAEGQTDAPIESCWKVNDEGGFTIFVDDDERSIQHATVRSFGYVLSQIITHLDIDPRTGDLVAAEDEAFVNAAVQLATNLLKDVRSNPKYDLSLYKDMLSPDVLTASDDATRIALAEARHRSFVDFAFAESFDSFHCSDESRALMAEEFSETYTMFAALDEAFGKSQTVDENDDGLEVDETRRVASSHYGLTAGYDMTFLGWLFRGAGNLLTGLWNGAGQVLGTVARGAGSVLSGIWNGGGWLLGNLWRGAGNVLGGIGRLGGGLIRGVGSWLFGYVDMPQGTHLFFENTLRRKSCFAA